MQEGRLVVDRGPLLRRRGRGQEPGPQPPAGITAVARTRVGVGSGCIVMPVTLAGTCAGAVGSAARAAGPRAACRSTWLPRGLPRSGLRALPAADLVHHRGMDAAKAALRRQFRAGRMQDVPGEADLLLETARRAGLVPPAEAAGRVLTGAVTKPPGPVGAPGAGSMPTIASYGPATGEPDVRSVNRAVAAGGGSVLLPIPRADRLLDWARDEGRYGVSALFPVPVPTGQVLGTGGRVLLDLDARLVLVPALAADRSGTRLGQGGGYYDRLLEELAGRIPALVVVRDGELLDAGVLPRHRHDQVVAGALTPTRVVWFG